jgi:hypothetical protein
MDINKSFIRSKNYYKLLLLLMKVNDGQKSKTAKINIKIIRKRETILLKKVIINYKHNKNYKLLINKTK